MKPLPPRLDGKDIAFSRIARLVRSHEPGDAPREREAESRERFRARLSARLQRPARRGTVTWGFAAVFACVVACGALLAVRHASDRRGEALQGVWDERMSERVRSAFLQTGVAYAVDTHARVARLLDRYAQALLSMRSEGRANAPEVELRKRCLDRRTGELSALTAVFSHAAEPGIVEHAIEATNALADVRGCTDAASLVASFQAPPDATIRQRVETVRARLDEAEGLVRAGQFKKALDLALPIAADALTTGHAPLEADALSLLGVLQMQIGDFPAAEKSLREGARAAARAHDEVREVVVLTHLFELVGHVLGRYEEAAALRDAADRAILRAGDPPALRARLSSREAEVLQQGGRRDEALAAAERAVALFTPIAGANLELAHALLSHARILGGLERYEDAQRSAERALSIQREELGPDHPEVGRSYKYVADFLMMRGRYAEARPYYERAISMAERSTGPRSVDMRGAYNGLAAVLHQEGRSDEALRYWREALSISDALGTPDASAAILLNMGNALRGLERRDEAEQACTRALSLLEEAHGNPINVPAALDCLGRIVADRGERAKASALYQRALSMYEGSSLDTPSHAATLVHLAESYLAEGRALEASPLLRRAVAVYDSQECDKGETGDAHFALARALWQSGKDRGRAVPLAERARADYAEAGRLNRDDLAAVTAWLAARGK